MSAFRFLIRMAYAIGVIAGLRVGYARGYLKGHEDGLEDGYLKSQSESATQIINLVAEVRAKADQACEEALNSSTKHEH